MTALAMVGYVLFMMVIWGAIFLFGGLPLPYAAACFLFFMVYPLIARLFEKERHE